MACRGLHAPGSREAPRALEVEWRPGRRVPALLQGRPGAPGVLLAPGAGAGQGHGFVAGLWGRLAAAGYPTMSFDYPYAAEGRRAPDRLEVLLTCHRAAARLLAAEAGGIVLAGKSMGGRVAGHLAASGEPCLGLAFLGYPLLSPGKGTPRDTSHLEGLRLPVLFLGGSRDRLAPLGLLRPLAARLPRARLVVLEGADHSFGVKAVPGARGEEMLDRLAEEMAAWLAGLGGR